MASNKWIFFSKVSLCFAAALVLLITNTTFAQTAPQKIDKKDKAVFKQNQLLSRGINVPSLQKMEDKHFKIIKQAGFSNVRIPIGPFKYLKNDTDFTIDTAYLSLLDKMVKMALDNKLMAIIDFHEHHAMEKDLMGNKEKFLAFWEQVANRYKNYAKEVLFEICNEPNMKDSIWNKLHSEAYTIIRKSNPKRTLLIGTIYGNQIKYLPNLKLPEADRNIIVTIHYYEPIQFTHQGAPWSIKNKNLSGIEWTSTTEQEQAIQKDFDFAAAWAAANKRPLHLCEFGVYEKTDMESRIRWTNYVARQAELRHWSWSYWEFNGGFGIYYMDKNEWKPGLFNALVPQKDK
jgi:endoglucanase